MHDLTEELHEMTAERRVIVLAGQHRGPEGSYVPPHSHEFWEWVYYYEGAPTMVMGGRLHEARPGVLLITPPGIPHDERGVTPYANIHLLIQAPADMPWARVCFDDKLGSIGQALGRVLYEWQHDHLMRTTMLSLYMTELEILVARATAASHIARSDQQLLAAKFWIEERFCTEWSTADLARAVAMSPSSLRLKFQQLYQKTPHEYSRWLRSQYAIDCLASSDLTLDAIAATCGYASASHLSRQIKAATGRSPGELRASRAANRT